MTALHGAGSAPLLHFDSLDVPATNRLRLLGPWALAALVVLCLSASVIAWNEWFPLDVPMLFEVCGNLNGAWGTFFNPTNSQGRLFPVYWIANCAQYVAFGETIRPYFIVQCIVLLGTGLMLCKLLRDAVGSAWWVPLLLPALYLSIPMAEVLSTLGKNEPVACLLMIGSVVLFQQLRRLGHFRVAGCAAAGVLFTLAVWAKETSIVMFVFASVGAVLAAVLGRMRTVRDAKPHVAGYLWLLGGLAAGYLLSRVPYFIFRDSLRPSAYTDYPITYELVLGNLQFYLHQQPDVVFFGVLAVAMLGLLLVRLGREPPAVQHMEPNQLVLMASLAALGWAYWLGLQIWRWPLNYYMLLPDSLFKLCALYAAVMLHRTGLLARPVKRVLAGAASLALLWATLGSFYLVSSQIAYSRLYSDAMRQIAKVATADTRVVMEPYGSFSEHVSATQRLLRNQLHLPLRVTGTAEMIDPTPPSPEVLRLFNFTQEEFAQARTAPLRQGDLLLTLTGTKLANWSLRGVAPYHLVQSSFETDHRYELQPIAENRISAPSLYLRVGSGVPEWGFSSLGYKLARVVPKQVRFQWSDRYPDGWIGEHSTLSIMPAYAERVVLSLRMLKYNVPATVRITRDGQPFKSIEVTNTDPVVVDAGAAPAAPTTFAFEISPTFVPKQVGLNDDGRRLGATIHLVSSAPAR